MSRDLHHRGFAGYWILSGMTALCGLAAFSVDYYRVHMIRTELHRAAAAAACAGAASMHEGAASAALQARKSAFQSPADGQPVELDPEIDIEFGTWDQGKSRFTKLETPEASSANAVRVTARRCAQRGTAVRLVFGRIIGQKACDLSAQSVAMVAPQKNSLN